FEDESQCHTLCPTHWDEKKNRNLSKSKGKIKNTRKSKGRKVIVETESEEEEQEEEEEEEQEQEEESESEYQCSQGYDKDMSQDSSQNNVARNITIVGDPPNSRPKRSKARAASGSYCVDNDIHDNKNIPTASLSLDDDDDNKSPSAREQLELSTTSEPLVILCTKLSASQKQRIKEFKQMFINRVSVVTEWTEEVTHLITSATKEAGRILEIRTIKYFQAVVTGSWILCFDWVDECIEKRCLVSELLFEVRDLCFRILFCSFWKTFFLLAKGAAKKSREDHQKRHDRGLFKDCAVIIDKHFDKQMYNDLMGIFHAAGATILKSLPLKWKKEAENKEIDRDNSKSYAFVYDPKNAVLINKQIDFCRQFKILTLELEQVFDAISDYLSSLSKYCLLDVFTTNWQFNGDMSHVILRYLFMFFNNAMRKKKRINTLIFFSLIIELT
ncbi:hypothetical protein RFI_10646, partial [Reticulomyxa filosa]